MSSASTSTSSSKVIEQWIHSTIHHKDQQQKQRPYLTLIQSSMSYTLRQTAVDSSGNPNSSTINDMEVLYRRARVRTPSTNAQREMTGGIAWLMHLQETTVKQGSDSHILWVSTTNSITPPTLSSSSKVHVVNVANDPIGWDNENDNTNDNYDYLSMLNLESISNAIQHEATKICNNSNNNNGKVTVVVESLGPLILLHGLSRIIQWLQQIPSSASSLSDNNNNIPHIIIPTNIETLTSWQHRQLEDIAHAILYLRNGEMTLIRQGVRDRSNILRQPIPFRFDYDGTSAATKNWVPIVLEQDEDTLPLVEDTTEQKDDKISKEGESIKWCKKTDLKI